MSRAINAFTRRYVYAAGALIATLGALVVFGVGTAAVMGLVVDMIIRICFNTGVRVESVDSKNEKSIGFGGCSTCERDRWWP